MEPTLNLFAVLNLLGAGQALLLALALVTVRRGRRARNLPPAAFAGVVAVQVAWVVFSTTRLYVWFPHLLRVNHPFDFAVAPLFYLYVRSPAGRDAGFKRRDLLHFVPAALCAVGLLPYYPSDGAFKLAHQSSAADVR